MAATPLSANLSGSDCDARVVDCFTPLERETSERLGLLDYDHRGLYTVDELDYRAQQRGCLECNGIEACRWRGRRVMYYVDHSIHAVCWTRYLCKEAATVNRQRALRRRVTEAGIPERYVGKAIADFDGAGNTLALQAIKMVISGKSAILYGGRGTGKTMLAAIVAQKLLRDGRDVQFVSAPNLFDQLRRGMQDGSIGARRQQACLCELLVIDDLGAELASAWTLEQLYMIVNERYNAQRQVLMTMNYTPIEAQKRWQTLSGDGERIYSRLREMAVFAEVKGSDRRLS